MITTRDGFLAAAREKIPFSKTTTRTTTALSWYSLFDIGGQPGAGTLAAGNTANGVVPTSNTPGCPNIMPFGAGATGYLAGMSFGSTVAGRLCLLDRLFAAGEYPFNAIQTLNSQPSIANRCPDYSGGANWGSGNQLWIEAVTAFTNALTVTITYTNEHGTPGCTTGPVNLGIAPTLGRMLQIPLQAGDSGIQKIESVTATGATAGTFNVLIVRQLFVGRVMTNNFGDVYGPDKTALPVIYPDSALQLIVSADGVSSGVPALLIDIING